MKKKKRYSKLEVEILTTTNGDISFNDIIGIKEQSSIWIDYVKSNNKKNKSKKYYKKRRRERYPRDESAYNSSQEEEFPIFLEYLEPAVNYVLDIYLPLNCSFEYYKKLHDNLICLLLKRHFGKSLRRSMGIIRYITKKDFPDVKIPCFKTLDNYQNNPVVSFYIDKIIEVTSEPLNIIETRFTTDGTGEATFRYSVWYSIKTGRKGKRRDHKIAQITSTTILNSVPVVNVLDSEDPNLLSKHVEIVSYNFNIGHWQGDSLYLTRANCNAVKSKNGKAHFRVKKNTITNAKGSYEWKRTTTLQKQENEKEINNLNLKQNVESTNSAKKRKFGSYTLCINDWSQIIDIKAGWCCYNFSVLSRAFYEYGIVPTFLTHKFSRCFFRLGAYT